MSFRPCHRFRERTEIEGAEPNDACNQCGRPMLVKLATRPALVFCSDDCERAHRNASRRKATEEKQCAQCGQTFTAKRTDARYCSARCRQQASRRRSSITTEPSR